MYPFSHPQIETISSVHKVAFKWRQHLHVCANAITRMTIVQLTEKETVSTQFFFFLQTLRALCYSGTCIPCSGTCLNVCTLECRRRRRKRRKKKERKNKTNKPKKEKKQLKAVRFFLTLYPNCTILPVFTLFITADTNGKFKFKNTTLLSVKIK